MPIEQAVIRAHEYPNAFSGEEGGCQARLILCRTTMDPKSGIDVVDVTETSEVQRYCQGHTIVRPEEIDVYRPFFCDKNETNENEEMQKRRMLDEKVKSLARFVAS